MPNFYPLTRPSEARLRIALSFSHSLTRNQLASRLMEADIGLTSLNAAYVLISHGHTAGLLIRTGGRGSSYELNHAWRHPSGRLPVLAIPAPPISAKRNDVDTFTLLNRIPTEHQGSLTASLGTRSVEGVDADGELLPCIGGRIVHALHDQFHVTFGALE